MAELPLNRLGNDSDDELTDDEEDDSPLTTAPSAPPDMDKLEHWDMFEDPPPPVSSMSEDTEHFGATILKFAKVLTYLLTFSVVLFGALIGKLMTLLMAAQLKPGRVTDLCPEHINEITNRDKQYYAETTPLENMAWAYALLFAYMTPEVGAWIRALRMCVFKGFVKKFWLRDVESQEQLEEVGHRRLMDTLVVILMETCHAVGTALLIYAVLPDIDSIRGAMLTNCLAFMPGLLGMFTRSSNDKNLAAKITIDIVAIACQLSGFVIWPLTMSFQGDTALLPVWAIPFALFLTSFGWWENFVDHRSKLGVVSYLGHIKRRLWRTRYAMYLFVPVIKCLMYFLVMIVVMGIRLNDFGVVFKLGQSLAPHNLTASELRVPLGDMGLFSAGTVDELVPLEEATYFTPDPNTPVYIFLVNLVSTWLCYVCGKFVCKIAMQQFSFSLPINLTVPIMVCLLMTVCGMRTDNVCAFSDTIPGYLFWAYEEGTSVFDFFVVDFSWLWFAWLLSQTWITLYIWTPKTEKLAKTEKIFVSPMYDSLLIDQSLALNRRKDDIEEEKKKKKKKKEEEDKANKEGERTELKWETLTETPEDVQPSDRTTRIFACATMWHETPDEMEEFLKSVMRVDEDQSARRIARNYLKINDPDYYEYQTHVFFDDAFELSDDNEDYYVVNRYVKYLLGSMDVAASHVHHTIMRLRPPVRYPTPYGGRLVWTLPGKTKFIVHLKDKQKIRHKKRWSQVMYMYYLLGFKLMDQESLSLARKDVIAENTYLLALDGDIDFTARSVRLLVELMKKDTNLGAACGRIHPVGSGLMVWYQKFEYAIGHWLQKATEHMIGCVLCSPGCFSMFRGRALMDDSVMRKYTTVSCKARHYVQYDQGEDRWLCTLLLKRGYRVEYSAASDAYTHCPEGFGEFYNQRRRWVPSTMANIMDVLEDYKLTVKINDNISMLYIAYQMMLMVGTILGPGTIFLMLVGALSAAFGISDLWAFLFNLFPILIFMITCYFAKSAVQLRLAYVLTAVYALLMCMVAIALAINIIEEGATTPTSIFLFATAASFIFTACLHPQEFWCLPSGLVYYLVVPSMYLLLQIYSCYNLNDVSWGTRDTPVKKTKEELEREKKQQEEAQKKQSQSGWLSFLSSNKKNKERGSIEFSLAGLFKIMCCVQPKPNESEHILRSIDSLKRQLERMEAQLGLTPAPTRRRSTAAGRQSLMSGHDSNNVPSVLGDGGDSSDVESQTSAIKEERNDLINPFWMEDKKAFGALGYTGNRTPGQAEGGVRFLTTTEVQFWEGVMERYLKPLENNEDDKKKAAQDLLDLRNMAVFSFSMMNAIFVVVVGLMQAHQDILYINWPIGATTNIYYEYSEETMDQIDISKEYVHLEPIGFVFVLFFGVVMLVQFTAMLFHRFGTFSQIIASTSVPCASSKKSHTNEDGVEVLSASQAVANIKLLQKVKNPDPVDQNADTAQIDATGRRRTIANIASSSKSPQVISLDEAFRRRVSRADAGAGENDLNRRRSTVMQLANNQRRMSLRRPSFRPSVSSPTEI